MTGKAKRRLWAVGKGVLYFATFLRVWQFLVVAFKIKVFILPPPTRVFAALLDPRYQWWKHILTTGGEIVLSFVFTSIVGITLSILLAWSKTLSKLIMPVIVLFNSIPKIALAPLFLMWFGFGMLPNMLVATIIAFFPVVVNTTVGLLEVDDDLLDLARYLNATKLQIFIKIRIPNSLPYVFAGLKIAATMCVVGSIVGEFVASSRGLGYLLRDSQAFIDTPPMFACLLLLSVVGLLFFTFLGVAEKLCMPWNHLGGGEVGK